MLRRKENSQRMFERKTKFERGEERTSKVTEVVRKENQSDRGCSRGK